MRGREIWVEDGDFSLGLYAVDKIVVTLSLYIVREIDVFGEKKLVGWEKGSNWFEAYSISYRRLINELKTLRTYYLLMNFFGI